MLKQRLKSGTPSFWLMGIVVLSSLACSFWGGDEHTIRIRTLPDLTSTAVSLAAAEEAPVEVMEATAVSQVAAAPTQTPLPTVAPAAVAGVQPVGTPAPAATAIAVAATETPLPLNFITATPPPTSPPANPVPTLPPPEPATSWSFIGVRITFDQENAHIIGEMVNNTDAPQTDIQVGSIVYGANNRVITDQVEMIDYVPVEVVPVGAHIPFELIVSAQEAVYRVDLTGVSYPAEASPRQDFQFASVNQWRDENLYCLGGQVQNNAPLGEYLIILAVTYNNSGQVVSFGEYADGDPENIGAGQSAPFEMCVDPSDQNIVHHELKAVGL